MNAYDELVEVIATGPAAERLIRFRASDENQRRVSELLEREKTASLSAEETAELDRYLQFEHVVRMAKARAQLYLQEQASGGTRG
jgi:hypothetical protein